MLRLAHPFARYSLVRWHLALLDVHVDVHVDGVKKPAR